MRYDDDIVIRRGGSRRGELRSAASSLLKSTADDSPLKTVLVWGIAVGGAYFGSKFLLANLTKTVAEHQVEVIKVNAQNNPNSAAGLASQLAAAFQTTDGATTYAWTDINEATIFAIFEGKRIVTRDFFIEVGSAYAKLTKGRSLLTDLQNEMGAMDYNRIRPFIDKIMVTSRPKAKPLSGTILPPDRLLTSTTGR